MRKRIVSYSLAPEVEAIVQAVANRYGLSRSAAATFIIQSWRDIVDLFAREEAKAVSATAGLTLAGMEN